MTVFEVRQALEALTRAAPRIAFCHPEKIDYALQNNLQLELEEGDSKGSTLVLR
jgi:hypothetical protein